MSGGRGGLNGACEGCGRTSRGADAGRNRQVAAAQVEAKHAVCRLAEHRQVEHEASKQQRRVKGKGAHRRMQESLIEVRDNSNGQTRAPSNAV